MHGRIAASLLPQLAAYRDKLRCPKTRTRNRFTTYKSPWRQVVVPGSGTQIVPSIGREYVLTPEEVKTITDAALKIRKTLKPSLDKDGKPMAWDIEYGFTGGKMWLFQVRPFIGNEDFSNVPALAGLDKEIKKIPARSPLKILSDELFCDNCLNLK